MKKYQRIRADPDFVKRLKVIKAVREIKGNPVGRMSDLTNEILNSPQFKEIEKELKNKKYKVKESLNEFK